MCVCVLYQYGLATDVHTHPFFRSAAAVAAAGANRPCEVGGRRQAYPAVTVSKGHSRGSSKGPQDMRMREGFGHAVMLPLLQRSESFCSSFCNHTALRTAPAARYVKEAERSCPHKRAFIHQQANILYQPRTASAGLTMHL